MTLTTTQSLLDSLEDLVVSLPLLLIVDALRSTLSTTTIVAVTPTRRLMMVTILWTTILVVNVGKANGLLPHLLLRLALQVTHHLLHLPLVMDLRHDLCRTSSPFRCTNTVTL